MTSGSSVGDGYGPILAAGTRWLQRSQGQARRGAGPADHGVPGFAALRNRDFEAVVLPFDHILEAVAEGFVDVGLVIHRAS